MAMQTLEKWIDGVQARGKYTFLRAKAVSGSGLSSDGVKKALQRLSRRGRVVKLKDYFYVVVPLEYTAAGAPPASWFIGDLMIAMGRPYYVGLLSAAGLHGASHQQVQEFQVFTNRPIRPLKAGRARVRFFTSKYAVGAAVMEMKTPTGAMRVSTPETTVVDLVRFATSAGGLGNVATVIAELASLLDPKRLLAAVRLVGDVPSAQRLGYLLDHFRQRRLSDPIHVWLERQSPRPLPLRSGRAVKGANESRRWHLLVNQSIEAEG